MQIKRFEAADMTDALRLVKREFGDDAVILSAKEIRPRGFFRSLRKKHVEIRAAMDQPSVAPPGDDEFTGLLAEQLDEISSADRVSLSTSPPRDPGRGGGTCRRPVGEVIDDADRPLLADYPRPASSTQPLEPLDGPTTLPDTRPCGQGASPLQEQGTSESAFTTTPAVRLIAAPFFKGAKNRTAIAVVGPPGSGKSTTVGKLAWHCQVIERQRVGLISLDHYRFAANSLLQRVAEIMDVPLELAPDAESLPSALERLVDAEVVLIDTPGVGPADASRLGAIGRLLQLAGVDETHLVVNATVRDEILARTVDAFLTVGADRLLPSHWDEREGCALQGFLEQYALPSAFYADGTDLWDNLRITSSDAAIRGYPTHQRSVGCVTAFPDADRRRLAVHAAGAGDLPARGFVANRNSELVHRPSCKSAKRISAQNITAFDTIEDAIHEGFKPCRACCDIDVIRQAAPFARWQPLANAM